jgi:multidrug efflux pump subunit AcrA (membrane-fusion protein)
MNPTDLLAGRHKAYRQARDRYLRATAAREQAQQRVNELERELATTEARDRVDLGEALVDKRKPPAAQADAARATLQAAKRDMEALQYAEQVPPASSTHCPERTRKRGSAEQNAISAPPGTTIATRSASSTRHGSSSSTKQPSSPI